MLIVPLPKEDDEDSLLKELKTEVEYTRILYANFIRKICDGKLDETAEYKEGTINSEIVSILNDMFGAIGLSSRNFTKKLGKERMLKAESLKNGIDE